MKNLVLCLLFPGLCLSHSAASHEWKKECVGYYQLELPENLEVALYPVDDFIKPRNEPVIIDGIKIQRYANSGITFDQNNYTRNRTSAVQAQFSAFYYDDYELDISSESNSPIDFISYREHIKDNKEFDNSVSRRREEHAFRMFKDPVTPKAEFERIHGYLIKDYPGAFSLYERRAYTLYINQQNRLYHFWKNYEKGTGDESQSAEKQWRRNEPEVLSLLSRFRPRKLYEVPAEQGFCMPYGFIAGDSGQEKHNMAVTYRLKDHPDVTIFFQDLGMKPEAGEEDNLNAKDYVKWLWNWQYQWSSVSKELISPKWRSIEMDGRNGLGTFVKSVFKDGVVNYGYVAYVQGDRNLRNKQPDLLLYVMQHGQLMNDQPPMDKDELEKMAEHIVSTVKRR